MALSVAIYHFKSWTVGVPDSSTLLGRLGIYAVSAFFIISGMSLYIAYRNTNWDKSAIKSFAFKRYLRLAPAFWVACIAMILVLCYSDPNYSLKWKQIFLNLTLTFGFFKPESYITVGGWSIGNEVVFYAMLPIILWPKSNRKIAILTALLLALISHLVYSLLILSPDGEYNAEKWFTYIKPWNNVFFFMTGIAIAWISIECKISKSSLYWIPITICAIAFFLYPADGQLINIMTGWHRIWLTILCVTLGFSVFNLKTKENSRLGKPLSILGELSYALYMFHGVAGEVTLKIILPRLGINSVETQLQALNYITLPMTLIASYIFFTMVERPVMSLGRNRSWASHKPLIETGRLP